MARQTGFLRRQSKLKPEEFIDTLMFSDWDHSKLSLQDCCNELAVQHQKSLSKEALHKRFNDRSLAFLKAVLADQMSTKLTVSHADSWQPFTRVIIADSCKFALPHEYSKDYPGFGGNRSKALMNIQYAFDLKQGDWETLELAKATQNDMAFSKQTLGHIHKGDLHLRDLGYMTHEYLFKVVNEGAFFVNRLRPQWLPVEVATGKPVNWSALYEKMRTLGTRCFKTMVTIGKGKDTFNCRMIAVPVPEQVWAERIRKAQKSARSIGNELSEEYKKRCRFSIFITNTDEGVLTADDVVQLYRIRWQIELIFKSWKSLLHLHRVKTVKNKRLECQLIAKFIWILLHWKVFHIINIFVRKTSPDHACSIWKFFKHFSHTKRALKAVLDNEIDLLKWLKIFIFPIIRKLLIEPKKGKTASFSIINTIFKPLG